MEKINRIKAVLAETGKTGKWLADQVDRDPATVSKWCTNAIQPDLQMLAKIANLLEVNIRDLLVDSKNKRRVTMQTEKTYNLTFTAGALLLNETYAVAEAYLECGRDWEKTQTRTFEQNLMAKDKVSTNKRFSPWSSNVSRRSMKRNSICWLTARCSSGGKCCFLLSVRLMHSSLISSP